MDDDFKRTPVEFITPDNNLKRKIGSGGLSEEILEKAEEVITENQEKFPEISKLYFKNFAEIVFQLEDESADDERLSDILIHDTTQFRADAGIFGYTLVGNMAGELLRFVKSLEIVDGEALEIINAFRAAMQAITNKNMSGDGGTHGTELLATLKEACKRYED